MSRPGEHFVLNGRHSQEMFHKFVDELVEQHPYLVFEWYHGRPIGVKQSAALHVYLRLLANELNANGYSVEKFFKSGIEIPFSQEIVKDNIWRPIMRAVTGKDSTQDLTTIETQEVFEHVNRAIGERGIHVPWPEKREKK